MQVLLPKKRCELRTSCLPPIRQSQSRAQFQVVSLPALLLMKLYLNRLKDRVQVLDLIGVGLVDASWLPRLPPALAKRLQQLFDNPNG